MNKIKITKKQLEKIKELKWIQTIKTSIGEGDKFICDDGSEYLITETGSYCSLDVNKNGLLKPTFDYVEFEKIDDNTSSWDMIKWNEIKELQQIKQSEYIKLDLLENKNGK